MQTSQTKNDKIRAWIESCPSWYEVGKTHLRQVEDRLDGKPTGETYTVKSLSILVDVE
tara:strand:+ start:384 stop:557 length:174 start_codon:yes stop_codon:yes gene_type:complete